jgi:dTDP-4-amino-4,6-dideoxygalactose transaminase
MRNVSMAEIKLTENEIAAAERVLRSGALRQGKECDRFEQQFAEKVGARHAVTNSNGSAALHLAYMAILNPEDEVLVPSFTFIATGSMVTATGGRPVFCDIEPDTFLIDMEDAERKVTSKTKAIAPVHLFGNPCNVNIIKAFAKKHNLRIVWDAAQAHGAIINGEDVGAMGDFTCYSFYPSKNMFVGEGGITTTDDPEMDRKMRFMRTHGQTGKYLHTMIGLNYRMTDVEAAIGVEQLKRLDDMLVIRRRNAARLSEGLQNIPGINPQKITENADSAWHQYCATIDTEEFGCDRDTLSEKLKDKGVANGVHYPRGLHQQPIFIELYGEQKLPNTEYISEHIIALPVHHGLVEEDLEYVIASLADIQTAN